MVKYQVWATNTNPATKGKIIVAASSFEARTICAKAWGMDVNKLMARAVNQPAAPVDPDTGA